MTCSMENETGKIKTETQEIDRNDNKMEEIAKNNIKELTLDKRGTVQRHHILLYHYIVEIKLK